MQIEKQHLNEQDGYLTKIAELRIVLEDLARQVNEAESKRDTALSAAKQANLEKEAVLTQTKIAVAHLGELEQLILAKSEKISQLTKDISNNIFNGDKQLAHKAHLIESANKEIVTLKKVLLTFNQLKQEYPDLLEHIQSLKYQKKSREDEIKKLDAEIKSKREKQLADLPVWFKAKSEAEQVLVNVEAKKQFVETALQQLKEFCEKNNIPFELTFKI